MFHKLLCVYLRVPLEIYYFLGGGGLKDITFTVIKEQIKRARYVQRILFVLTVFEIIKENCPKVSKSLHSPKTS